MYFNIEVLRHIVEYRTNVLTPLFRIKRMQQQQTQADSNGSEPTAKAKSHEAREEGRPERRMLLGALEGTGQSFRHVRPRQC